MGNRISRCLAVASLVALGSTDASAFCGFYVGGADAKLFNNATQVVLMREGARTVLSMANDYQGPPENFAMVIPVPVVLQKENVKTLPKDLFQRVDQLSAPRLVEYWEQDPCAHTERGAGFGMRMASRAAAEAAPPSPGAVADMGVRIEAQFTVGEYEVVILSAEDSMGLDTWLRREKYRIPEGAEPAMRPYVQMGSKFFVAKVDVEKVKFKDGKAQLSPLRFHYDDDRFMLPVRLGLINSSGTQDLIISILARNQRYEVANYPNATIPTNIELSDRGKDEFGAFYAALFDQTIEKLPKAVVTEYAWSAGSCDPCPGPALSQGDLNLLGADVVAPPDRGDRSYLPRGMQTWEVTLTRLHARYQKDALGEDLVFRKAPPLQGGNAFGGGKDKHAPSVLADGGQSMFQGRYIVRHPWQGEITCPDPRYGVWGGQPGSVKPAQDLAFAPRGKASFGEWMTEDVPSLGLRGTPRDVQRRMNVSLTAYLRGTRTVALLGLALGALAAAGLALKNRRAS